MKCGCVSGMSFGEPEPDCSSCGGSGKITKKQLQARLDVVQEKISGYALGDRPPSPPVSLIQEELDLLEALRQEAK